jgi:hypothetical protein
MIPVIRIYDEAGNMIDTHEHARENFTCKAPVSDPKGPRRAFVGVIATHG